MHPRSRIRGREPPPRRRRHREDDTADGPRRPCRRPPRGHTTTTTSVEPATRCPEREPSSRRPAPIDEKPPARRPRCRCGSAAPRPTLLEAAAGTTTWSRRASSPSTFSTPGKTPAPSSTTFSTPETTLSSAELVRSVK
ncbi:hypothetical protein ZWY2020_050587 [Hordeum vulgare]|nr:hypothetical protein ZWY2020_050587 [Hordeum vulgare]